MTPIYTGQDNLTPQQRDNETLAEAIKRREDGKVISDLIRKDQGRMKIEKEKP